MNRTQSADSHLPPGGVRRARRAGRAKLAVFSSALFLSLPRESAAAASLSYKFQDYREESDRIRVVSHYAMAEVDLGAAARLSARGVVDTITGATPTGEPAPAGSTQVPLSSLEDERHAGVGDLTLSFGDNRVRLEYAYSRESDYLSAGYSGSYVRLLNRKNTEVQVGFSYVDDDIQPRFFAAPRHKVSRDFLVGVTQILSANTMLTLNLGYGTASGFLSDPYKIVQKTTEIIPGLSLPLTFPENRPGRREKTTGFAQVEHFVERLHGSAEASLRLYHDDHGIDSQTLELAWFQRFGPRLIVRPNLRFYRQGAADYYVVRLDDTPIVPVPAPDGGAPFYSSDYRLSKFDAITAGVKVIYEVDQRWAFDAQFEHYAMHGRDGATPESAYAAANIFTIGWRVWF